MGVTSNQCWKGWGFRARHCTTSGSGIILTSISTAAIPDDPAHLAASSGQAYFALPRIISAAFCATIMVGALVLAEVTVGKIDASTTHKPSTPKTRSCGSTTASPIFDPMRQVEVG